MARRPGPERISWEGIERDVKRMLKDPEMNRLAEKAVRSQEAWNRRRSKMTAAQLKADDEAWAKRMAESLARFTD